MLRAIFKPHPPKVKWALTSMKLRHWGSGTQELEPFQNWKGISFWRCRNQTSLPLLQKRGKIFWIPVWENMQLWTLCCYSLLLWALAEKAKSSSYKLSFFPLYERRFAVKIQCFRRVEYPVLRAREAFKKNPVPLFMLPTHMPFQYVFPSTR